MKIKQNKSCSNVFVPAADVLERYGVSEVTLWRWLRDEELGFPRPTYIRRRRYWIVDDLVAWENRRITKRGE